MTRDQENGVEEFTGLEIAVIGMAGQFPGAGDIHEYWENLSRGIECISFFSDGELEGDGVEPRILEEPNYVKAYGMAVEAEYFDADFFDYSPREAEVMDPQMRVFHEFAWKALEDAGYFPGNYEGHIGFYAGASSNLNWQAQVLISGKADRLGQFAAVQLMDKDFLTLRISYKLNLKGPAVLIQTACSTSLAAIHIACQAILNGECEMALAGGVKINKLKKGGYLYQDGMVQSPDGHCRAFDTKAKGTVEGEGVGVVVLKRLDEATDDSDHIYAVVKGSAINNDGLRKIGFTAPSIKGQTEVIMTALAMAEVDPDSITYVEAHGTGTELGDPVEIEALKQAFNTDKKGYCAIGSVKTNIGHLDTAAGVAGFIKAVLAIYHRSIPPSLHYETVNPKIDFDNNPFYVNTKLSPWRNDSYPLRAGVSSLGMGGTNAHVILEEAPEIRQSDSQRSELPHLIVFSAKSETALETMRENLVDFFKQNRGSNLADTAYTLQVGRGRFKYRQTLVCSTVNEAIEIMSSTGNGKLHSHMQREEEQTPPMVFMFPGQGAQYVNMGLGLYNNEPLFREEMDRCFEILNPLMSYNLKEILYPEEATKAQRHKENTNQDIDRTEITQPLIFAVEYALAKLLMRWGIQPYAMIGHSIGEYTAACLSGVFSLEDALKIVVLRGKLMQGQPGGAMLSVPIPEKELALLLESQPAVSLAAVNSSSLCTVSGSHEAIDAFARQLEEKGHSFRRLHTSHAFHSATMDRVLGEFEAAVGKVKLNPPHLPYISNLTGKWISVREAADPAYWSTHLRKTVRFADGLKELLSKENSIFIEAGPGNVLSTLVRKHADITPTHHVVNLIRHPREEAADNYFLLTQAGRLWLYGAAMDWQAFHAGSEEVRKHRRISLPSYPFERKSFALSADLSGMKKYQIGRKKDIDDWFYIPQWTRSFLAAGGKKTPDGSCWLVFMDGRGLGERLLKALEKQGLEVIIVKKAGVFARLNRNEYTLAPGEKGHYEALFQELQAGGRIPGKIVHLWNVTGDPGKPLPGESLEEAQEAGFYSLLWLAQCIGRLNAPHAVFDIEVISDNMQEVVGGDGQCPQKSLLLGPVKVIPKEYPNIRCRSLDIQYPVPGGGRAKSNGNTGDEGSADEFPVEQMMGEFLSEPVPAEPAAALRGNYRWVPAFKAVRLEKSPEHPLPVCLKENGVYLVTGGLGGIGFVLAEHLVKSVHARVVLTGRSAFPPAAEWERWLDTHDNEERTGLKIRKVRELEAQGGEVLVLSADAADEAQMQRVKDQALERFGRIDGVIHAAGVPDGGMIQQRSRESFEQVLVPKVKGTLVLETLLKDQKLDFFILCSSLSSFLSPFGQVGYCSANAFLDAFAVYGSNRSKTNIISINWDSWREVGMAVEAARQLKVDPGAAFKDSLSSSEGVEVFNRILGNPLPFPQAAVSTRDLQVMTEMQKTAHLQVPGFMDASKQKKKDADEPLHRRPDLSTAYVEPEDELEQTIAVILQDFLGIEKVGIDDNFFDLGISSLDLVQISSLLKEKLGREVPVVTLFTYATVRALARYLQQEESGSDETGAAAVLDEPEDLLESTIDLLSGPLEVNE